MHPIFHLGSSFVVFNRAFRHYMKISKQTTKVIQKSIKSTMQFTAFTIPATDDTNAMNVPKTPNN